MPQLIEPSTGKLRDVADQDVAGAIAAGWTPESQADVERLSTGAANELNFGGVGGGINAALAGIARGATLGASDVAASALGGQDATATLEGLRAQNPYTSGAGEFAGMLLPAVLTGGAATPAGIAVTIGRRAAAGATREGAGVLGRVAGHAIGAAAEGSLYGGGQYLSETALENKPLSAEGFIGGMGKGALFAAPVGGTFALAGETLQRARSLFPRSEVTAEAAAAVKSDASAAIRESLTDGDAMAETARRRIEMADAQAGAAGARTQVTRRVFGGGDPSVLGAQVDATANKAQLVEALGKLETSQTALKDWIAAGGDVELEASMAGLEASGVQTRPGVPVGEFGAPGKGGIKSREEISRAAADAGMPEGNVSGASVAPTEPAPATNVIRKGAGSGPARTGLDDIGAAPPGGPSVARAPSLDDIGPGAATPRAVESTRVLRAAAPAAQADHAADDVAREAIASMNEAQLNKLQDDLNEQFKHVKPGDPEHKALSDLMDQVQEAQRPFFDKRFGSVGSETAPPAASQHGEDMRALHRSLSEFEHATGETIPAVEAPSSLFKEHGYYEPPGGHADPVRTAKARAAMVEGQREPISITVSPSGKLLVNDGRHRLAAAIEADVPIEVKWSTGSEPSASDVLRHGSGAVEPAAPATDTLTGLLRGTKAKLDEGASLNDIGAPARSEYAAAKAERTAAAREHFRGEANAKNFAASEMGAAERSAQPMERSADQATNIGKRSAPTEAADVRLTEMLDGGRPPLPEARGEIGKMFGIDMAPEVAEQAGTAEDLKILLSSWSDSTAGTAVDRGMRARMSTVADDAAIERLLQKRAGKNVDIGPQLAQAAKLIGDHEAASSEVAGLLGADAPKTAVQRAQAYQAARAAQAEAQGASAAKAAQGIQDRAVPAMGSSRTEVYSDVAKALQKHESAIEGAKDRALVSMQRAETKAATKAAATRALAPAGGIGSKLADVGTALEVMKALGVHVPVLSAIPVIGPVLGLFLKARAALSILGRKGGSIGRSTEGLIAATSAATRERLATATQAILTGAGKGALKLSEISAGPAVTLGYKLFPGPGVTKSRDPVKLYEARMDEIARAQQPGAIDHAISDRYQTGDPKLHDAMVGQVQRGIAFLDSKAPKPTIMQSMLPGDGVWRPSKAQLDEWGKYVHAVGDPASVLEDLAKGHVTLEGAETLRVVYPELFAEGQRLLLQAAPQMQKSLPYPTRVAILILYRIPVDGSMQPGHLQYLQQGQGPASGAPVGGPLGAGGAAPPSLTGPIKLGQSTMTSLDHRSGS